MNNRKPYLAKLSVGLAIGLTSAPAFAYLDPGTGSLIIQGIIGAVAAAGVAGRLYWYKIKGFLTGQRGEESFTDSDASGTDVSDSQTKS